MKAWGWGVGEEGPPDLTPCASLVLFIYFFKKAPPAFSLCTIGEVPDLNTQDLPPTLNNKQQKFSFALKAGGGGEAARKLTDSRSKISHTSCNSSELHWSTDFICALFHIFRGRKVETHLTWGKGRTGVQRLGTMQTALSSLDVLLLTPNHEV